MKQASELLNRTKVCDGHFLRGTLVRFGVGRHDWIAQISCKVIFVLEKEPSHFRVGAEASSGVTVFVRAIDGDTGYNATGQTRDA